MENGKITTINFRKWKIWERREEESGNELRVCIYPSAVKGGIIFLHAWPSFSFYFSLFLFFCRTFESFLASGRIFLQSRYGLLSPELCADYSNRSCSIVRYHDFRNTCFPAFCQMHLVFPCLINTFASKPELFYIQIDGWWTGVDIQEVDLLLSRFSHHDCFTLWLVVYCRMALV